MSQLWAKQDLVHVEQLTKEHINELLDLAKVFESGYKDITEINKSKQKPVIASCFFEPSTRTRLSFEAAAHRIGANVIGFSDAKTTSSGQKGESLQDSIKVISSYADLIIMRHPNAGSAKLASVVSSVPVINAGDGSNQHPTQTLLDLYAIQKSQNGNLEDLNILVMGDLKNGRTVHSLVQAMRFYNPRFYFVSPKALSLPKSLLNWLRDNGVRFSLHSSKSEVLEYADIAYVTRLQKERLDLNLDDDLMQAEQSYFDQCCLGVDDLSDVKDNFKILHPMPRKDELSTRLDQTKYAYYFEQAKLGVPVRAALLSLILGDS
jgi:aspartate carbamoyltransferase catalytic subunit